MISARQFGSRHDNCGQHLIRCSTGVCRRRRTPLRGDRIDDLILVILAGLKPLEEAYRARIQSYILHVRSERDAVTIEVLKKLLRVRAGQVKRVQVKPAADDLEDTTIHLIRAS